MIAVLLIGLVVLLLLQTNDSFLATTSSDVFKNQPTEDDGSNDNNSIDNETRAEEEEPDQVDGTIDAPVTTTTHRIIALGDLHGDKLMAVKAMRLAGIIDENENWAASSSVFVQTVKINDHM